jgi:signal transduction histidine kinase
MQAEHQASQFSNRLFTRLYVALVVTLIILGSGLEYVMNRMDEASLVSELKQLNQPVFAAISQSLLEQDPAEWPAHIADLQPHMSTPLWLMSRSDFAADEATLQQLNSGHMLALFDVTDQLTLYQRIGDSDAVLGITTQLPQVKDQRAWVLPVFYLLLALVVYVLIRPFTRQLLQLKQAAVDFGQGDFSARVQVPASTTLAPIADAFNAMTRRIEGLLLTQRDLVNAVSHELRTPLARLKFSFEALDHAPDQQQLAHITAAMRTDVSELEMLIDEMLRYAEVNQIEAFERRPVNIRQLLTGLLDLQPAERPELRVELDPGLTQDASIRCHESQLLRALSNVIRNAISFADQLCLVKAQLRDRQLIIDVCDDGIGLQEVDVNRLFEPFYKVNNSHRCSGYGLGLSIASTIVKKHQGELKVMDGPLPGACFRFVLPIA